MAIKGKSRRRTRTRSPGQAPRPSISPRRTPFALRRDVKRTLLIVLSVASLLGGLRLWQNISRSDALREFNRRVLTAQQLLLSHFGQQSLTPFDQLPQQFAQGQLDATRFKEVTELWEKDFNSAKQALGKVKAPNKLTVEARTFFVEGIDGYVGVARLYNVAAQVKLLADATVDATQKQKLNDQVQVLIQHASEWVTRANGIYQHGSTIIQDLNKRYGLEPKQPAQQTDQTGTTGTG